jgi:hypothetical protein
MTSNRSVTTNKIALNFSQQKKDPNAEQKKTAALEQCLREMESALSTGILPTLPQPGGTMPPHSKSVRICSHSTQMDITLLQKFDSLLNLPPTYNDTPAKASSSPMADVGRWICSLVSPLLQVDIGGVGRRPLWSNIFYSPTSSELAILSATTYFAPPNPNHMNKHPNNNRGHGSHCQ